MSPSSHGQVDRTSGGGGGGSMCGPTTADRDILVYQQLTTLINAGYSEVSVFGDGGAVLGRDLRAGEIRLGRCRPRGTGGGSLNLFNSAPNRTRAAIKLLLCSGHWPPVTAIKVLRCATLAECVALSARRSMDNEANALYSRSLGQLLSLAEG